MPPATERVFALKNVRIFYKKTGRMKFVSHLDMNRFMSRLIARAKIPVWYTEGFNQRIYINFALPLSLGFEGLYEIMDIRLSDDSYDAEECLKRLNAASCEGIEFISIAEPVKKVCEIGFAEFSIESPQLCGEVAAELCKFLNRPSVICTKSGKKGKLKEIDIIPKIKSLSVNGNVLNICLTAGNEDNLNPSLVISEFFAQTDIPPFFYTVTRTAIFDRDGNLFV